MSVNQETDVLAQALAEPTRRAILENLRLGQKTVSELVRATQRKQPNLSNHLAKMRRQGLVRAERIGRQVYYSLSTPFAEALMRVHETTANPLTGEDTDPARLLLSGSAASQSSLTEWRDAYLQGLLAKQDDRVVALVNTMLAQRLELETIYIEVFQPALYRIGELYTQGEIDEAQEHLAAAITERMMAKVMQFYAPVVRAAHRAVLGCVAGNWHALGLRMLADGLRVLGWETLFLGANVPTASFLTMVTMSRPSLVVVSCSQEEQLVETTDLLDQLNALREKDASLPFQIAVGGYSLHVHQELPPGLRADFTAPDLSHFLREVQNRFSLPSSNALP